MIPTNKLLQIIKDDTAPGQARIEAIEQLGAIWIQQKEQRTQGGLAKDFGAQFTGKDDILQVIHSQDRIDVRCQAAALLGRIDSRTALQVCNDLLELHT